ncbi:MAG TPA: diguanylate cyclase [Clostridia bacterium]|nr:diguanylate cyclase [Clostridia bacterium]
MHKHEDYYRILQVHYLAEPEVIESAYRRLAKKYHPDVNKGENSVEMMQKINQAYEELSNPVKRQQYNMEWEDKYNKSRGSDYEHKKAYEKNEKSLLVAKSVLDEYFGNIMNNHFDFAYELVSNIDKLNIAKDDFINWQCAVSMVFHLKEYSCKIYGTYKNKLLNGHMFHDIVEFSVNVVEYNSVMDMVEKDALIKMTVLEDGKWRVFIGYEKLQPLISKFKALTNLLTAKSVLSELMETHSKVDSLTSLLNQRGIIERVENEIHRFDRYGNVFSLIVCDIDIIKVINKSIEQEVKDCAVKCVGEILVNNLRKLDVVGRWGEKAFLILLPETRLSSAKKVTEKICRILKSKKLVHNDKTYRVFAKFGTVQYTSSLEESLDRINSQINL